MLKNSHILESRGLISRRIVRAEISENEGLGIRFISPEKFIIEAKLENLYSTQRNTVLASKENPCESICLTEHFLAALALLNIKNIDIKLSDYELPFGDGSARIWIDFFREKKLASKIKDSKFSLKKILLVHDDTNPEKFIKAIPSENFSIKYMMNWDHPKILKQDFTWRLGDSIEEVSDARTFASEAENQILGLSNWVIGLTENDFTMPLRFPDEPSRHKTLDLIGDLMLSGYNPLEVKMELISNQGGHELNSKMAHELTQFVSS